MSIPGTAKKMQQHFKNRADKIAGILANRNKKAERLQQNKGSIKEYGKKKKQAAAKQETDV